MTLPDSAQAPLPQPSLARTNVLAVSAIVAAFPMPVAGIVLGHLALAQIRRTGEQGYGLALAGTVVGYSLIGLALVIGLVSVAFVVVVLGTLTLAGPAMPIPVP